MLSIRQMFDEIAPRYDFLNHALSLGLDQQWRRRVARICPSNGYVLDLCTGTGDLAFTVAKHAGGRVIGIDFAEAMIRLARQKLARLSHTTASVDFARADALRLPFSSETFDACTCAWGIRNVANVGSLEQALRELARVTKPQGRLLVLEFGKPPFAILRPFYHFYFRRILPPFGNLISRSRFLAYRYLPESVEKFFSPHELIQHLHSCGWTKAKAVPLSGGITFLYAAVRA